MAYEYQDTLNKLMNYIKNTGWEIALKDYWRSDNFKEVITQLHIMSDDGKKFVPKVKDIFRWMIECPYSTVKCVMVIDDSRNYIGIPGIPYSQDPVNMSKSKAFKLHHTEDTKENRNETIEQFIYRLKRDKEDEFDYDLTRWCNQGVLMMPYSLTHRIGVLSRVHEDLWKEFRARIIEEIGYNYPDIPWLLVGPMTYRYRELINSDNILNVRIDHAKSENNHWPFWINDKLKEAGKTPIIWNKEDLYPYKEEITGLKHINFGYSILKGYF